MNMPVKLNDLNCRLINLLMIIGLVLRDVQHYSLTLFKVYLGVN